MLNDVNQEVTKLYGLASDMAESAGVIVVYRSIFVLDEEGVITYIWKSRSQNAEPNYDDLQNTVERIS